MRFPAPSAVRALSALVTLALPAARHASAQGSWHMSLGPEDSADIGMLRNAPNGHISYQEGKSGLTIWVDGRIGDATQGTFILHPHSWSILELERAAPVRVFEAVHDSTLPCTSDSGWYRNYAAINAIIPGPQPGELLAFVDGEVHPRNTGIPLRTSIGGGMTWGQRAVIVQGNDMVAYHFDCRALDATMKTKVDDEGSAGPTAVVRTEGGTQYVYLYYFDRVRLSSGGRPTSDIYVARAPYAHAGAPGSWQFWTNGRWSPQGPEVVASPVITTPPHGGAAAHPLVTFNTALGRWLMIFHTRLDFYATTSADGITWDTPQALGASIRGARAPAFPTLVTPGSGDQQTTGATGWLFYSREVNLSATRKGYLGFRRSFIISTGPSGSATSRHRPSRTASPRTGPDAHEARVQSPERRGRVDRRRADEDRAEPHGEHPSR